MAWTQWLGVPEGDSGLLGDPRAYGAAQGLAGLSSTFGMLGAAFAPTTDPGARGRIMASIGQASQNAMAGVRQGAMQDYAGMRAKQGADREAALGEAMSGKPDDQLSEAGRQSRGLLAQLPERVRAALPLLSPEQRGTVLAAALRPGERQGVVMRPGDVYYDTSTNQPSYSVPPAPQRPPLPGAYDHLRFAPDGSLVDLRQFGGGGGRPPAAPAAPAGAPPLASPDLGLPAPGRPAAFAPPQPPPGAAPDASPAGGAQMLTPQPGDTTQAQAAPPAAALPPGTVRPPPPPEWQTVTDQNRQMYGLPAPREGAVWQRNGRTGETRQIGGEGVRVQTNVGENTTAKKVAEQWDLQEQAVQDAGRRERLYTNIERLAPSFRSGVGADARLFMGQIAREFGIRTDGVAEGEVMRQIQRQLELAATPKGQGQITENERKLIRDMVPVWGNTPEGVARGLTLLRQLDAYDMGVARIYRENARRNNGTPDPVTVREEIAQYAASNPMPDVNRELSGYVDPVSRNITPPPAATAARPRARNAQGQVIEFNGQAWVPVQ